MSSIILLGVQSLFFLCAAHEIINICENETGTITCDGLITVTSARYGRFDRVTCPHVAMTLTGCSADGVFASIISQCDGETTCTLTPTNTKYGDPCPVTYKYLEVNYTCQSPETTPQIIEGPPTTTPMSPSTPSALSDMATTTHSEPNTSTTYSSIATSKSLQRNVSCACNCRHINDTTCEDGDILCTLAVLKKQLLINKNILSSYKRSKISVYESRTSATVIGLSGALVIIAIFSIIIIPDVIRMIRYIITF